MVCALPCSIYSPPPAAVYSFPDAGAGGLTHQSLVSHHKQDQDCPVLLMVPENDPEVYATQREGTMEPHPKNHQMTFSYSIFVSEYQRDVIYVCK